MVGRFRRYRGQANPGNWEELAPGSSKWTQRGSPRITARQFRLQSGVMRKEKEGGRGHRPCEETRAEWFGCPHVGYAVAEVVRRRLVSNKLGPRSTKMLQGRVNGDLARRERRWVKPSTGSASERYVGDSGLNLHWECQKHSGKVRTKTQGGARVSLSGWSIAKSGEPVAGPGL